MLVIGITSRALFDLDDSHKVFEEQGLEAYREYQISKENEALNLASKSFGIKKNSLYKLLLKEN